MARKGDNADDSAQETQDAAEAAEQQNPAALGNEDGPVDNQADAAGDLAAQAKTEASAAPPKLLEIVVGAQIVLEKAGDLGRAARLHDLALRVSEMRGVLPEALTASVGTEAEHGVRELFAIL